jgi:hypothetical protein
VRALALVFVAAAAHAGVPKGFAVVPKSISPDGKLEVIAPADATSTQPDQLVEVATGKVVATLISTPAPLRQSNLEFHPSWSKDGSLLEWYVDGKWGSWALLLVRVEHGAVAAQIDARELAVHEVLADVQQHHASAAAAAKREGKAAGAWFRDGLAIDVRPSGTERGDDGLTVPAPSLPLSLDVTYTSNPKQLDTYPKAAQLDGSLALVIDAQGKLARR